MDKYYPSRIFYFDTNANRSQIPIQILYNRIWISGHGNGYVSSNCSVSFYVSEYTVCKNKEVRDNLMHVDYKEYLGWMALLIDHLSNQRSVPNRPSAPLLHYKTLDVKNWFRQQIRERNLVAPCRTNGWWMKIKYSGNGGGDGWTTGWAAMCLDRDIDHLRSFLRLWTGRSVGQNTAMGTGRPWDSGYWK